MHIDYEQDRQRWREDGKYRSQRFKTQEEAERFAASISEPPAEPTFDGAAGPDGGSVYAYKTSEGRRWRFVFRQSDRSLTTRRGFTSPSAAQAARAAAVEEVRRGDVVVSRGTFGEFWGQLLEAKRPYVTAGTLQDYKTHGRKRLLPWFGDLRLAAIDEDHIREWIGEMSELVADGELSAKTGNNDRTCLSMTLGEAVRRRHLTHARRIPDRHGGPDLRSPCRPLDRPRRGRRGRPHRAPARAY